MFRLKILIISMMIAASIVGAYSEAYAASKGWESVKTEHRDAKSIIKDSEIEIKTLPSLIIVNVSHPTRIEVFTILGRLVSAETLQPGTFEFAVGAHGVYIVKVGELTCKVAI